MFPIITLLFVQCLGFYEGLKTCTASCIHFKKVYLIRGTELCENTDKLVADH